MKGGHSMVAKIVNATWVENMQSYRIYDPATPQKTIAYEDDLENAKEWACEEGYSLVVENQ